MPTVVTAYALGVWFCVGLFTGLGWALGTGLMNRLLNRAIGP